MQYVTAPRGGIEEGEIYVHSEEDIPQPLIQRHERMDEARGGETATMQDLPSKCPHGLLRSVALSATIYRYRRNVQRDLRYILTKEPNQVYS